MIGFVKGSVYSVKLQYRSGNGRVVIRRMVAAFIDEEPDAYIFDLRPVAGTQSVPRSWVVDAEIVPLNTQRRAPRNERSAP